jgi:CBS domain-containing protein
MPRSDSTHDEGKRRREPPRRSASAEAGAVRWEESQPVDPHAPPPGAGDRPRQPGDRHSASAEAAALRWQEQHADDAAPVALVDSPDPPGSYLTPSFEHARVGDAMRPRVLTCEPGTPLMAVAQRMASEHVHAIVVLLEATEPEREIDRRPLAVITDRDILRNADSIAGRTAGDVTTGEVFLANPDERLPDVARRMLEHGTSHAVVVEPRTGRAVGVLSTLDIAGVLGWGLG